jgi:hypothetical protein
MFLIEFLGRISWEGQSNGLPPKIYAYIIIDPENKEDVIKVVEAQSRQFIAAQGMAVAKDQGQLIDLRALNTNRIFVPMRWIVDISVEVRNITGEVPVEDETGATVLPSGKKVVEQ